MRFHRIRLVNWRCFLGEANIQFADTDRENITILIGQNGSGKTALLNAFTWVLFCETTAGFRQPSDLFNHSALGSLGPGESARMEVLIEFEHEGAYFEIKRYQIADRTGTYEKPAVSAPKLSATRRKDGATEKIEQADIEKILPRGLHSFFFFPAESIGKELASGEDGAIRASMVNAIDVLLGIDRYDRAVEVISRALCQHLKTPRGLSTTALADAEIAMKKARDAWEEMVTRKKQLPELIRQSRANQESLSDQLGNLEAYEELKADLDACNAEIQAAQKNAYVARELQADLVNSYACVLFGGELFADALDVLDKAHKAGAIPPKISAGLLRELIDERKKCICGNDLGSEEISHLEQLSARTVSDQIVETASNLRGRLPGLITDGGEPLDKCTASKILDFARQAAIADNDVRRHTNRLHGLLSRRHETSHASKKGTMEAWKQAVIATRNLEEEQNEIASKLPKLEGDKTDAENQHQNILKQDSKTRSVGRAREYLSNVERVLTEIQDIIRSSAREDVQRAMNLFFQPLLLKNYCIKLTDEFRYQVVDPTSGRNVGASSSEIALATFAFVGAVASLMPAYANIESLIPQGDGKSPGGVTPSLHDAYPVVLDAPYSPFGEEYSDRFSNKLPDLLPQSVIIVREDQVKYLRPMLDAGRVGHAYVLQMHTGKQESKRMSWQNAEVDYVINTMDEASPHTTLISLQLE